MPRRRVLDPEFWNDSELGAQHSDLRLLYEATWTEADDEGRLLYDVKRLHRLAFGYNKKVPIKRVESLLLCLIALKKLLPYSKNGKSCLFVKNFSSWQTINRPTPSKLPAPPADIFGVTEPSLSPHGGLTPKLREVKLIKVKLIEDKLIEVSSRFPIYKQISIEDLHSLEAEFPEISARQILGDLLAWERDKNKGKTQRPFVRLRNFFKTAEKDRLEKEAKGGKTKRGKYSGLEE